MRADEDASEGLAEVNQSDFYVRSSRPALDRDRRGRVSLRIRQAQGPEYIGIEIALRAVTVCKVHCGHWLSPLSSHFVKESRNRLASSFVSRQFIHQHRFCFHHHCIACHSVLVSFIQSNVSHSFPLSFHAGSCSTRIVTRW